MSATDSDRAMYILVTTQKKDGATYKTFRLVESSRTERGPRQRTVLNLGTGFSLPEEQWKELANRIEEIITGQKNIFPCPPDIEDLANIYVQRIIVQIGGRFFEKARYNLHKSAHFLVEFPSKRVFISTMQTNLTDTQFFPNA
jgi:hypothetical protein